MAVYVIASLTIKDPVRGLQTDGAANHGKYGGRFIAHGSRVDILVAFPVGFQVGKLRKIGVLPVKFDVQAQYFAVRPQVNGPKWNLQFQITPIVPALIKGHRGAGT